MGIQYFNEDVSFPQLKKRNTSNWLKEVINAEEKNLGVITFVFCSDSYLLEMNKKFLDHDYFTDIITFDYVEGSLVSGDIFISIDRVIENASVFKTTFTNELNRILVHGVLHLLGYKDKSKKDKAIMTGKEDFYLNLLLKN